MTSVKFHINSFKKSCECGVCGVASGWSPRHINTLEDWVLRQGKFNVTETYTIMSDFSNVRHFSRREPSSYVKWHGTPPTWLRCRDTITQTKTVFCSSDLGLCIVFVFFFYNFFFWFGCCIIFFCFNLFFFCCCFGIWKFTNVPLALSLFLFCFFFVFFFGISNLKKLRAGNFSQTHRI